MDLEEMYKGFLALSVISVTNGCPGRLFWRRISQEGDTVLPVRSILTRLRYIFSSSDIMGSSWK